MSKISTAKFRLMLEHPFFAYLVSSLHIDVNEKVKTAQVHPDGRVEIPSRWVEELGIEHIETLLAHEAMHLAFDHFGRMGARDLTRWNVACDIAINIILENSGFSMPEWTPVIKEFSGFSAEKIYEMIRVVRNEGCRLMRCTGGVWKGMGKIMNDLGDGVWCNDMSRDRFGDKFSDLWKSKLAEAYTYCKSIGKVPAGIEEIVKSILYPQVGWRYLLWKYIMSYIPHDFCMHKPNRRFAWQGIYLPSVKRENIDVVVAVDTSRSISQRELQAFFGEILSIVRSINNVSGTLITCDAAVQNVFHLDRNFDPTGMEIRGRGGTDFRPVFEYIERNIPNCSVLIYLTDLLGTFPSAKPRYPVIWVSTTDERAPFGTVIRIRAGES